MLTQHNKTKNIKPEHRLYTLNTNKMEPLKKHFDVNIEKQMLNLSRSYGLIKTATSKAQLRSTAKITPITTQPETQKESILTKVVTLETEVPRDQSPSMQSSDSVGMSFEMKRKLFDAGEFTITQGRKLADVYGPQWKFRAPREEHPSIVQSDGQSF